MPDSLLPGTLVNWLPEESLENEAVRRMEPSQLTWNAGYIWGIPDDVLRDLDNGLADDLLDGDEPMDDTELDTEPEEGEA